MSSLSVLSGSRVICLSASATPASIRLSSTSSPSVKMALKLHGMQMSTCTRRILMTLAEKGVTDFELVNVDLMTGAHKSPDFLKLQPFGQVPALQDGDLTLFESRACARYIAEKFAEDGTALLGATPEEKALVNVWWEAESQEYNGPIAGIVAEKVFKAMRGQEADPAAVKDLLEKAGKVLDVYEERLSKHDYLAGDNFTLADLSHLPYTHYLINGANEGDLINSRPNVKAWWERISSRPTWQKIANPPSS